jgi:tetratricopeptide (TPR) repeat protein
MTLGAAGMRAWRRADLPTTTDLLARAVDLLPNDALRRTLLCELGVAYFSAGGTARAERTLKEALHSAVAAGDPMTELRARIELASVGLHGDPEGKADDLLRTAARATPLFEAAGNDRALGRTWLVVGFVEGSHRCRNKAWEDAAERALVHYDRAAWPAATPLGQLCAALYYGPTPARTASSRCEELLRDSMSDRAGRAQVLRYQAGLTAMSGDFDTARRLSDEARETFAELGQTGLATHCSAVLGDIELLAGAADAARRSYEILCRFCEENGEHGMLSTYATDLAEALYRLGELEEADRWTSVSEAHRATDDIGAQFASQAMRAKLLARRGAVDRAEPLAKRAAALASTTDALNKRAAALLALADVLGLAGKAPESAEAARQALALYEQKGNTAAAKRARLMTGSPTT